MRLDTEQKGLLVAFKQYQIDALKAIWESESGLSSGKIFDIITERGTKISRTSVILSMNDFVEEGLLTYQEATGKGGRHRIYQPNSPTFAEGVDCMRKKIIDQLEAQLKI